MKAIYKGHEINVTRAFSMGGWMSIYYSIFRQSDGYECARGFSAGDETPVREFMKCMKERVDAELSEADPWMELADSEGNREDRGNI